MKDKKIIIVSVLGVIAVIPSIIFLNRENLNEKIFDNSKKVSESESQSKEINKEDIDNRKVVKVKIKNKNKVLDLIVENIKSELDPDFNIKNYKKEVSNGPDGKIYDFNYMIGDVKTTHGYTAMVENDYVEIYDNMGDFKEKVKNGITYNKDLDDNKKVKVYANELIENYKKQYKDYNISLDSTLKVYDDKKEKVVVHINIKMVSKNTKATSIATEIME